MAKKNSDPENRLVLDPSRLEVVPLDDLVLDPKNPNLGQVEDIKDSFLRFGQDQPLVVRRDNKVIIKGNHRWKAAKDLGWDAVAVYWVDDDEVTSIMRGLADNRIGQKAVFDQEALHALMDDVRQQAEDLGLDDIAIPGFDDAFMEDLNAQFEAPPSLDDLEDEHGGEPDDRDFWPVVRLKVPPDLNDRWREVVKDHDDDELAAFTYLVNRGDGA